MGRLRRSRTHSNPKKNTAPGLKTRRYKRDLDQIYEDLKDDGSLKKEEDLRTKDVEELPGMGQFLCVHCARYFSNIEAFATHKKSKIHKRQVKKLQEEPYTIEESRRAVGLGTDNGDARRKKAVEKMQVEAA